MRGWHRTTFFEPTIFLIVNSSTFSQTLLVFLFSRFLTINHLSRRVESEQAVQLPGICTGPGPLLHRQEGGQRGSREERYLSADQGRETEDGKEGSGSQE